ncbi:MAG: hypothetical protein AB4426_12370 [Xenococcaceae cyanobacterium]
MSTLRQPLFFFAIALITICVVVELGASAILSRNLPEKAGVIVAAFDAPIPGYGIPYLALVDSLVLFTVLLMAVSLLWSRHLHARTQGIVTLIFALFILLLALSKIVLALVTLTVMVSLLLAVPFGTIAYFALYAKFYRYGATVILGMLATLKLGFAGCLLFAQQRFLQNIGLVLIVLTSLLATLIVSFLHALVPGFLVSITDAIAGIIVAILAIIWSLFLLVGSLISIFKAIV